MNIRNVEDMATSRIEQSTPVNNGKCRQLRRQDGDEDSVNTSAIGNMLSQDLQCLMKDNDVRQEKIEHFKSFVESENNFSDSTVNKIFSNMVNA